MKSKSWWKKGLVMMSMLVLPASNTYKLEGFTFGGGGGIDLGSSNYSAQGKVGQLSNNKSVGNSYELGAGLAFQRQSGVPNAPTWVNDGNFSNKLKLIIDPTSGATQNNGFPSTGILDNFNRANGSIGSSWSYDTSIYQVNSNNMAQTGTSGLIFWNQIMGTDQEAYIKIVTVGTTSANSEIDLVLKAQCITGPACDMAEVYYSPKNKKLQFWGSVSNSWTQYGSDIGVSIFAGDVLGGRMTSDGMLRAYVNGTEIASVDMSAWTEYASTGYIGFWTGEQDNAVYDDFGGGNYSGSGGNVPLSTDTKYAIAVSNDNFVTTKYIQAADYTIGNNLTLNDFQTYDQWGGASGVYIVGLDVGTTYTVKVKSIQGKYSESGWGEIATAGTVSQILNFDLDVSATDQETDPPYLMDLGDLNPDTVVTSNSRVWVDIETNSASGAEVHVYGKNNGLYSALVNYNIGATTANLDVLPQGFGVQAVGATQASGGPLTAISPFDGGGNVVGNSDSTIKTIFKSNSAVTGGRGSFLIKVKSSNSTPAANDYSEIMTVVASSNF